MGIKTIIGMKKALYKEETRLLARLKEANMQERQSLEGSILTTQKIISWLGD